MDFWVNEDKGDWYRFDEKNVKWLRMRVSLVSKECWRLQCSKVVMASPAERENGIPTPKCIPSGKGKFKMSWYAYCKPSISHGGLIK